MNIKNLLRRKFIDFTGYWIFKRGQLPIGTDIIEDLINKLDIPLNNIFDVGANIGQSARVFSDHFANSKIFSFEPINSTFEELKKNTKHIKNIECHKIAFGEEVKTVEVKLHDYPSLNTLNLSIMNDSPSAKVEKITTSTIDAFMQENKKIENIDLLKIDVEGFEIPVLSGAIKSIKSGNVKLIYLEVGFSKSNERNSYFPMVHEFMEQNGFTFFGLYEIFYHYKSSTHYGNALYIHNNYLHKIKQWRASV